MESALDLTRIAQLNGVPSTRSDTGSHNRFSHPILRAVRIRVAKRVFVPTAIIRFVKWMRAIIMILSRAVNAQESIAGDAHYGFLTVTPAAQISWPVSCPAQITIRRTIIATMGINVGISITTAAAATAAAGCAITTILSISIVKGSGPRERWRIAAAAGRIIGGGVVEGAL
jgi:hypothetical protein